MILCIKTDSPEAYIGLWSVEGEQIAETWVAGRELSNQILSVISANCDKIAISLEDIKGVVVYHGPGSYTGLRIGISVANSIAFSYRIPVISSSGQDWIMQGLMKATISGEFEPISPEYGGEVKTTKPRK